MEERALLSEIKALIETKPRLLNEEENFFEVARIRDWETSISNVWGYFVNPNEKHGMGRTVLNVVEEVVANKLEKTIEDQQSVFLGDEITILREQATEHLKRPDIIILGPNGYIILENKIYASAGNNDIRVEYKNEARRQYKNMYHQSPQVEYAGYIVRSPKVISDIKGTVIDKTSEGDFYITYDDIFSRIRSDKQQSELFKQFRKAESLMLDNEDRRKHLNLVSELDYVFSKENMAQFDEYLTAQRTIITELLDQLSKSVVVELQQVKNDAPNPDMVNTFTYPGNRNAFNWATFSGVEDYDKYGDYSFFIYYSFGMFGKTPGDIYLKLLVKGHSNKGYKVASEAISEINGRYEGAEDQLATVEESGIEYRVTTVNELLAIYEGMPADQAIEQNEVYKNIVNRIATMIVNKSQEKFND